jgi:signal transduction histidine kinase
LISTVGGWTIALRHGAGSLDAAVDQARRRNLLISFSILSVLAFGVGIIVANARRAEKLAAQQMDFVATVSHELRTPLSVIRAAAQNLSAGVVEDPGRAKRYGELIESEGRRLTDMVEEVLEFAGLSGQRRPLALKAVDLVSLVRNVVASSSTLIAAAHAQTDVKIGDDVPLVNGDEEALRRAISNLLANALKHGGDGHWVGVDVRRQQQHGRDEVHIAVSDRGRGIDAEDLSRVFEPFYRGRHAVDQQIQGYGLGLSLVQRIAEAHGGRITVSSEPGQGSTFTLQLPVAADLAGV